MEKPTSSDAKPQQVQLTGISPPKPLRMVGDNLAEIWRLWKQQWENYAIVAQLDERPEKFRVAMFLHAVGPEGLKAYNTMTFEDEPTLQSILSNFEQLAIGTLNETYERYIFNRRNQEPDESIAQYITTLRALSRTCNFGDLHDSLLRDRIVLGVNDPNTRKKLLQERDLSLDRCIDICKGAEATKHQIKAMGEEGKIQQMRKNFEKKKRQYNPVQKEQYSGIRECKFCGRKHEMVKSKCPALGKTCNLCKRSNHFAAKCPRKDKKIRIVEETDSSELSSETEFISTVSRINSLGGKSSAAIYANMLIDNQPVRFQVDCGASVNTISKRLVQGKKIDNGPVSLRMWNSSKVEAIGTCRLKVINPSNNRKYSIEFVVVDNDDLTPLLGSKASQQMGLITVNTDKFVCMNVITGLPQSETKSIRDEFADIFDGSLGTFPGTVHLETDSSVTPSILPPRRVPHAIKDQLKGELDDMVKKGILSP
ncbi:Hypothetical predicted protein, partial [Paramuricea clavata]